MTLNKAQKKAAKDLLGMTALWRPGMHDSEAISVGGHPVIYQLSTDLWKVFTDLPPALSWKDMIADDWELQPIWL